MHCFKVFLKDCTVVFACFFPQKSEPSMVREGIKNIKRGGVYQFCALRAPDADPPHFRRIRSVPPPKMQVFSVHPPQIDYAGENFEKKILGNHPKKAKKLQIYSIIRPNLMKNLDPPPILATPLPKQQTPPTCE